MVAILTVLLSILLPVLSSSISRAQRARTLSTMRTHASAFGLYVSDHRDMFPYFTAPGIDNDIELDGGGLLNNTFYFDAHRTWHHVLAGTYYGLSGFSEVFFPGAEPGVDDEWQLYTPVHYPCVFIAKPHFWRPETRSIHAPFGHTQAGEVRHASDKALLVLRPPTGPSAGANSLRAHRAVAFCDGSVQDVPHLQTRDGYPNGEGIDFIAQGAIHFSDSPRLLHTLDGVHGRDRRP